MGDSKECIATQGNLSKKRTRDEDSQIVLYKDEVRKLLPIIAQQTIGALDLLIGHPNQAFQAICHGER